MNPPASAAYNGAMLSGGKILVWFVIAAVMVVSPGLCCCGGAAETAPQGRAASGHGEGCPRHRHCSPERPRHTDPCSCGGSASQAKALPDETAVTPEFSTTFYFNLLPAPQPFKTVGLESFPVVLNGHGSPGPPRPSLLNLGCLLTV